MLSQFALYVAMLLASVKVAASASTEGSDFVFGDLDQEAPLGMSPETFYGSTSVTAPDAQRVFGISGANLSLPGGPEISNYNGWSLKMSVSKDVPIDDDDAHTTTVTLAKLSVDYPSAAGPVAGSNDTDDQWKVCATVLRGLTANSTLYGGQDGSCGDIWTPECRKDLANIQGVFPTFCERTLDIPATCEYAFLSANDVETNRVQTISMILSTHFT
jgi:hypothetical protein